MTWTYLKHGGVHCVTGMDHLTFEMDFIFRAVDQDGANRIKAVIVTASKGPSPCFCYLGNRKIFQCLVIYWSVDARLFLFLFVKYNPRHFCLEILEALCSKSQIRQHGLQ